MTKQNYQITKLQCEQSIKKSNKVCSRCGGELQAIETVDNEYQPTYWPGCCDHFDYGVDKDVFQIAEKLFESGTRAYCVDEKMKSDNGYIYFKKSQISGICRMVYKFRIFEKEIKNGIYKTRTPRNL